MLISVLYRIRDWDRHFENNRTRGLKKLSWVPMPVKHDGDGYTELLDHPAGAAHFGAWCALVEVAGKCAERGTLLRDTAEPHNSATLSRLTRIPASVWDEALPRLVKIGWLEEVTPIRQEGAALVPQEGAAFLNGMEGKGKRERVRAREEVEDAEKNGTGGETPVSPESDPEWTALGELREHGGIQREAFLRLKHDHPDADWPGLIREMVLADANTLGGVRSAWGWLLAALKKGQREAASGKRPEWAVGRSSIE